MAFKSDADEQAYHRSMEKLTRERGFLTLSQAHRIAANDCPKGCACSGCANIKADLSEWRARRDKKRAVAA